MISALEAFIAAARRQPEDAVRHARDTLAHAGTLGISADDVRWVWPLAARTAHDLGDTAAIRELLALLDDAQPGHMAPLLRAERDLARVRLASRDGDPAAEAFFTAAITSLRELGSPYHLAYGLLDHAQYLTGLGNTDAAETAIAEARDIAARLGCQPSWTGPRP
jgi:hypothetical protein